MNNLITYQINKTFKNFSNKIKNKTNNNIINGNIIPKKLSCLVMLLFVSFNIGCLKGHISAKQQAYHNKTNHQLICEEYVNRIAKILLIVSDDNNRYSPTRVFIKNQDILSLEFGLSGNLRNQDAQNYITISKGILDYLQDEAELAVIIAIALEKINNSFDFEISNSMAANQVDLRIINNLYQAGYDPRAFLELQIEYLQNKHTKNNWLKFLFAGINITEDRIKINSIYILNNIPKGLRRDKQNYLSNIYLLKDNY